MPDSRIDDRDFTLVPPAVHRARPPPPALCERFRKVSRMIPSNLFLAWRHDHSWRRYPTGVSLHSHTSHSRETLDFIPRLSVKVPGLREGVAVLEARYRRLHGHELDYFDAWWTPPLAPREAWETEVGQIRALGMDPLVSITDHDDIEAPLLLRVLNASRHIPISVEWTVPFGPTFFHLGIHNLPAKHARQRMETLASFTARPQPALIEGLLEWLTEDESTLVVFNHPYWDEKGNGQPLHDELTREFIRRHRRHLHALELNGMRPWQENRRVVELSRQSGIPLISGGDRHACEPNALLNVTHARTFSEFVEEIRLEQRSHIVCMPQYRDPLVRRVIRAVGEVMRDHDNHSLGWRRWSDRVFYRRRSGDIASLSSYWTQGEPALIRSFASLARLSEYRGMQAALRMAFPAFQELP